MFLTSFFHCYCRIIAHSYQHCLHGFWVVVSSLDWRPWCCCSCSDQSDSRYHLTPTFSITLANLLPYPSCCCSRNSHRLERTVSRDLSSFLILIFFSVRVASVLHLSIPWFSHWLCSLFHAALVRAVWARSWRFLVMMAMSLCTKLSISALSTEVRVQHSLWYSLVSRHWIRRSCSGVRNNKYISTKRFNFWIHNSW